MSGVVYILIMDVGVGEMLAFLGKGIPGFILFSDHPRRILPTLDISDGFGGFCRELSDITVNPNGDVTVL